MKIEKDSFRMDLRYAKLCMELDCNTVFDASMYRHCPACSSAEFYPLESWLNRDRSPRTPVAVPAALSDVTDGLPSTPRALWLARLRAARGASESRGVGAPVRLRVRSALGRRAG
ncbi:MAG: hypothetical protein ACREKB_09845 [Candidatus Rokuibacteriota bacterium]